ncbi:hypothetical protein ACHAWF_009296 [Thalassiosira exigua]
MVWKYPPVLNKLLQILTTIAIGTGTGGLGHFSDQFVTHAVKFVFFIALPSLIVKGIGIGVDFYSEKNIWTFIVAFLILRVIALFFALVEILLANWKQGRSNSKLGLKYGIMAAISSFIFQLPLQLAFLECHTAEEHENRIVHSDPQHQGSQVQIKDSVTVQVTPNSSTHRVEAGAGTENHRSWWSLVHFEHLSNAQLWIKVGKGVATNPVLWAIFVGFAVSLSTVGKYLRCPSETCIPGLEWIGDTLGWVGNTVSPISLFTMGLWTRGHGMRRLFSLHLCKLAFFMVSKLVFVPLMMMGLAYGMGLNDVSGRAAINIAILPISMASFSLGHQYNIGEEELAANVTAGTLLMLPAVLLWNIILDNLGLYPIVHASA